MSVETEKPQLTLDDLVDDIENQLTTKFDSINGFEQANVIIQLALVKAINKQNDLLETQNEHLEEVSRHTHSLTEMSDYTEGLFKQAWTGLHTGLEELTEAVKELKE